MKRLFASVSIFSLFIWAGSTFATPIPPEDVTLNTVPEPGTMLLLGTALIGFAFLNIRKKMKK